MYEYEGYSGVIVMKLFTRYSETTVPRSNSSLYTPLLDSGHVCIRPVNTKDLRAVICLTMNDTLL